MEQLLKEQSINQYELEKFIVNLKKTPKDRRTEGNLKKRGEILEELWKKCALTNRKMLELYKADQHNEIPYFKNDIYSTLEESYFNTYGTLHELLKPFIPTTTTTSTSNDPSVQNQYPIIVQKECNEIPLPRINIPTFLGGYQSWISFRDLFEGLIHNNRTLSDVQKLHYLHSCLGGEAKQLIRHLQVSAANYKAAWDLLKKRYQNERALVSAQLQVLTSLPTQQTETSASIKKFLDQINECLEGLKSLKIDISTWDPILIHLFVQKLTRETVTQWELALNNRTNPSELPKVDEFTEFLEGRFRTLDAIGRAKGHKEFSSKSPTANSHEQVTKVFTANISHLCPICGQDHRLKQCTKFLSMSVKNRYEFIKNHSRCINCLSKMHNVKDCPNPMNCHQCGKRHNSLLHFNTQNEFKGHLGKSKNASQTTRQPHPALIHHKAHYAPQPKIVNKIENPSNVNVGSNNIEQSLPPQYRSFTLPSSSEEMTSFTAQTNGNIQSHFVNQTQMSSVLLATAIVSVITPNEDIQYMRVLLDQGSQASFITEDAVQRLRLQKKPSYAIISGICNAQSGTARHVVSCTIQSLQNSRFRRVIEAFVLPKITGIIPAQHIHATSISYLKNVPLADPNFLQPGKIDLLLGAEIYADLIIDGVIKGPQNYPIAQNTVLGWIVSGRIPNCDVQADSKPKVSLVCNSAEVHELECVLKQFWELEEIPTYIKHPEEDFCEEIYSKQHYRRADGRYIVPLLFKNDMTPSLGQSREIAFRRLLHLERRFQRDPELQKSYKGFMNEYLELGHMQKIGNTSTNAVTNETAEYFIPHHAVIKEASTTTKLRVVFNASSKSTNQKSLNDFLTPGPPLQQDLCNILIRWRKYYVALTADIEKMYRQILIEPQHCQFQKILWRSDPSNPVEEYKLLTVTYGTTSAPYLAMRTLRQLAYDEVNNFPAITEKILSDFYVDDLMTGADSIEEAIILQNQMRELLKKGGFNLRKWVCNSEEVLSQIPSSDCEVHIPFDIDFNETVKALGIRWNPKCDTFEFKVSLKPILIPVTKREFLSQVARLFDPLGWLAPMIISVKIMFQKLWIDGLSWDDKLPRKLEQQWTEFRSKLNVIETIKIPRWMQITSNQLVELHAFCDASTFAYAAVVYSRCVSPKNEVTITLIAAKTRVAPIKQISIPRLELCAAHLLSKLVNHVKNAIQVPKIKIYNWTDSLNVLAWLRGHPRQWHTFVANRVSEIQENSIGHQWRYVKSVDNPADCASRGINPEELVNHPLWWSGPAWLKSEKDSWPSNMNLEISTDLEARKTVLINTHIYKYDLEIIERFSTVNRLIRVIAYCRRFYTNLKSGKEYKKTDVLSVAELTAARSCIEKCIQRIYFAEEIALLENQQKLPRTSKLASLYPFIDHQGLLRISGRLKHANLPYNEKHPILLPEKSHFTKLIIEESHQRTLHGGTQLTLNIIRKRYWIPNSRNIVRQHIHKCVPCFRHKANAQQQLMGDLPPARVHPNRPFLHTGVDFSGYIVIRESKGRGRPKTSKGYISVFVCLCTKAVHLELVSELTTDAFLAAFRRFTSRRGPCSDVYSDCGTNFIGASKQLAEDYLKCSYGLSENMRETLAMSGTQWHFIPPAAPHFGGLWEAGVKSVKYHLKRIIGNALLTYEELSTLLTQIEACLNSRPLCPMSNDPDDLTALTPGHFLIGEATLTPPEPSLLDVKPNSLKRWHHIQRLLQHFWKQWMAEYLPRLQQRSKWTKPVTSLQEGNLILVKDERLPPARWMLGRVMEVHPGKDGLVRVVTVRTKNTILKRPITKLALLPINDNQAQ